MSKQRVALAKVAALAIGSLMEPREKLAAAFASCIHADEYLAGTARLLLTKAEKMCEDAKAFEQTGALNFNAKDVTATKNDMTTMTGTAPLACMHRCPLGGDDRLRR